MGAPLKGLVRGRTIVLDEAVPPLEGKRVVVLLEPLEEPIPGSEQTVQAWQSWVASGPQGPIEIDSAPELP